MGVVRLLCITIAFAFLATVAAQDCSSNGVRVGGRCVCTSGFAGALCETQNPGACFASIHTPQNLKDNWFPDLVQEQNGVKLVDSLAISFTNNVLKLNINGELVSQRVYTDIKFINNLNPTTLVTDSRCSLSGGNSSFWTQSNQVAELPQTDVHGNPKYAYRCGDLFTLSMPWIDHTSCGFSVNPTFELATSVFHQYEAIIKMTYDDQLDVFDPQNPNPAPEDDIRGPMTRHASVSYTIHVQFTKIINVQVSEIVVFSQVNLTVVLTQFEYDPATSAATMTFASIVRWPHMAVRNFTTIEIPHNAALTFGAGSGNPVTGTSWIVHPDTDSTIRIDSATDVCDETMPSDPEHGPRCLQRFTTKVYLGTGSCNFDGTYIFGTLVSTCRDSVNYRSCPSEMQFVGLKLANSGVCGSVTAEPQVTGELVAYKDSAMTEAANDFLVGSKTYFAVKVNTRNSFHLKWLDIFTISTDDTDLWDMNDKIPNVNNLTYVRPAHAQYFVKDARLQYNNFFTQTHPNFDASFDPAKYPNGPVEIQGWQTEVSITGNHLTDSAVVMGPNFNFRWVGGIFTPGINKKKVYNVIAKAQLTFEGNEAENRKREVKVVDFVYKSETSGMTANILCGLMAEETVAPAPASEAVTSSSVNMVAVKAAVPVAGVALVVVAVAVIAAVVIVRRKKNASGFRTLN